ncbi:unnamed protein product [Acanthoscelides obtectus]|uniref:Uncharacterized protein n=1 Tax=Acanthoscelides obtectus TaxID=200917 RepID=A0A9P0Q1L0_ACAOB|nr:unnamed protein product [Acanthoscelides obtectus]CAK1641152.1 hypothetical protein AOBTE_LOCUS12195 [Acanthoscelides obtectus]
MSEIPVHKSILDSGLCRVLGYKMFKIPRSCRISKYEVLQVVNRKIELQHEVKSEKLYDIKFHN